MSDSKANYHICGLDFELVGDAITTRQDDYLMAHLRRAGVMDVIATMKDADAEEKSSELLDANPHVGTEERDPRGTAHGVR